MTNKLESMMQLQREFQVVYNKHSIESQEYINEMALALVAEVMEAVNETAWKPWKKKQEFNHEKFKEELIDCWKFLINLTLSSGMEPAELYELFLSKHKIIIQRQIKGE